ncbi:cytochrome b [Burkholderia sp. THE68]|nr:cytochrome b [Burkholderia sp. THE68]
MSSGDGKTGNIEHLGESNMESSARIAAPAPAQRYSATAIGLHWLIALLIVGGFWLGWIMTDIPGITPTKLKYFSWHKWIGVTVFALALLRLIWRATHAAPAMPDGMPQWQQRAANFAHFLLYALMLIIPASGYLYSSAAGIQVVYLGVLPLPTIIGPDKALKATLRIVHVALNYTLLFFVVMHVLAALKHHFVDRDGLLGRMLPFLR